MKSTLHILWRVLCPFIAGMALLYGSFLFPQDLEEKTVAVYDFNLTGVSKAEAAALADQLRQELSNLDLFQVMSYDDMLARIEAVGIPVGECPTDACLMGVGRIVGVDQIIGGSVSKAEGLIAVSTRLIDVATGELLLTADLDGGGDIGEVLTSGMNRIARTLAGLPPEEIEVSEEKIQIAVLRFDALGIPGIEAMALSDRLRTELFQLEKFVVVDRGMMEQILTEQEFQQLGCTSDECLTEVGQLLNVQQMVGGSVSKVGRTFSVSCRLVDVGQGKIINVSAFDHRGEIDDLLTEGMKHVALQLAGLLEDEVEEEPVVEEITQPEDVEEEAEAPEPAAPPEAAAPIEEPEVPPVQELLPTGHYPSKVKLFGGGFFSLDNELTRRGMIAVSIPLPDSLKRLSILIVQPTVTIGYKQNAFNKNNNKYWTFLSNEVTIPAGYYFHVSEDYFALLEMKTYVYNEVSGRGLSIFAGVGPSFGGHKEKTVDSLEWTEEVMDTVGLLFTAGASLVLANRLAIEGRYLWVYGVDIPRLYVNLGYAI